MHSTILNRNKSKKDYTEILLKMEEKEVKLKKYLCVILISVVCISMVAVLLLSGCKTAAETTAAETTAAETTAAETTAAETTAAAEKEYTIGIVLKSFVDPFWLMADAGAKAKAKELGVNVIILSISAETAYEEQVAKTEDIATQDIDLLVIVPAEASAILPVVESIVDSGIPVIILDSPLGSEKTISFIGSDNVVGGAMAGEYIAKQLNGEGKVAVIRGMLGNPVELERYEGFTGKIAEYPGIEIVSEGVANWETDKGYTVMEDILTANPDIQAVFGECDSMILGASGAAEAAERDDIILVGLDGIVDALRAVRDHTISADVAQRPDLMGSYAVEKGLEYLKTGKIEKVIHTPLTLAVPDNVDPLIKAWEELGF